jgi:hypothetical protein
MSYQTRPEDRDPTRFRLVLSGGRRGHKFSLRELHRRLQRTTLGIIDGATADSFCTLSQVQSLHRPSRVGAPGSRSAILELLSEVFKDNIPNQSGDYRDEEVRTRKDVVQGKR